MSGETKEVSKDQETINQLTAEVNSLRNMNNELANLVNVKSQLVTDLDRIAQIRNNDIQSLQVGKSYYLTGDDIVDLYEEATSQLKTGGETIKVTKSLRKINDSLQDVSVEFVFDSTGGELKLLSPAFNVSNL